MPETLRLAQRTLASAVLIAALSLLATGASAQSIAPGITPNGPLPQQLLVDGGFEDLGSSLNTPNRGWERVNFEVAGAVPLPLHPNLRGLGLAGGTLVWDARVTPFCGNNVLGTGNTGAGPGAG